MIYDLAGTELNFVHKRIFGAAKSFITSGFSPTAAVGGFLQKPNGGARFPPRRAVSRRTPRPPPLSARTRAPSAAPRPVTRVQLAADTGAPSAAPRPVSRLTQDFPGQARRAAGCGIGFVLRNGKCERAGGFIPAAERFFDADFPGGTQRGITGGTTRRTQVARRRGTGQAVIGAFGIPAEVPDEELVRRLVCPPGTVLGKDELCYMKAVLPRRSRFRKWRPAPRPTLSRADENHIRKAAAAKERVLVLAKKAGLHASKSRPALRSKKAHQHLIAAPARQLQVISEETN